MRAGSHVEPLKLIALSTLVGCTSSAPERCALVPDNGDVYSKNPCPAPRAEAHANALWSAAADDMWAVGDRGEVDHYDGSSWQLILSGTGSKLRAVFGLNAKDVWAVGDDGTAIHWDGNFWSQSVTGTSQVLRAVHGAAGDDVWAVGDAGTILHWDGAVWSSVASGTTEYLSGVYFGARDDGWTFRSTELFHWEGRAWSSFPMDIGIADSIGGTGPAIVLLASGPYYYHYDGTAWSSMYTTLLGVFGHPGGTLLAGTETWGLGSSESHFPQAISDSAFRFDGTNWVEMLRMNNAWASAIGGSGPTDVAIAMNNDGHACIIRFDGQTWTQDP